jgi:tripartite-type tricarboxylate transporter receptor subunit TctC
LPNRVDFAFPVTIDVVERLKFGDLRLLAVTSENRLPNLPDVPTMVELGHADFIPVVWYGYVVPANTPSAIVERLYAAFAKVVADPGVQARLKSLGLVTKLMAPAAFGEFMSTERARWRKVITDNAIVADQ